MHGLEFPHLGMLDPAHVNTKVLDELNATLDVLSQHYRHTYRNAEREKEAPIGSMTANSGAAQSLFPTC
ncbi:MAG: hypothetical protein IPH00_01460 [Flavobacteriales bacterium]|nr:hypothetical protein [Flavobacteriales bacterium]